MSRQGRSPANAVAGSHLANPLPPPLIARSPTVKLERRGRLERRRHSDEPRMPTARTPFVVPLGQFEFYRLIVAQRG